MHVICQYFSQKSPATGGWKHSSQMPLTIKQTNGIKSIITNYLKEERFMSIEVLERQKIILLLSNWTDV